MHTHLVSEVGLLAARMLFWVGLLWWLVPRLLLGARRARRPHHHAQIALGLTSAAALSLALGHLGTGAVAIGAALAVTCLRRRFGRSDPLEVARDLWIGSVALVRRCGSTAARRPRHLLLAAMRLARARLPPRRGSRAALAALVAGGVSAAVGVALACGRASMATCLTEAQVARLLQRAGATSAEGAWLPELALERLFEALAGGAPAPASVALAAPLVFLSAASGMRLLPRFAPDAPCWLGALAGALVPACALLAGHDASLRLLVAPLMPWACALGGAAAWRSGRPLWACLALAPVHPYGGVLAFTGASLALAFDGRLRLERALLARAAAALALATLLAVLGAWSASRALLAAPAEAPGLGGATLATLAAGVPASVWLLLGAARCAPRVAASRRALGAFLALVLVISGCLGGPLAAALPPHAALALTAHGLAVCAADLVPHARRIGVLFGVAGGALVASTLAPAPPGRLACDVLEIASTLRSQHLPYTYVVAGAPADRAAFEGAAWWVDASAPGELRAHAEALERTLDDGHAVFLLARVREAAGATWAPPMACEPMGSTSGDGPTLYRLRRAPADAGVASLR